MLEEPLENLSVMCPKCGKRWVLHNYALVSVAERDRVVVCRDCIDKARKQGKIT